MKKIAKRLNGLKETADEQQMGAINNILDAIQYLEEYEIDEAAGCLMYCDYDDNGSEIVDRESLFEMVRSEEYLQNVIYLLEDIEYTHSKYYRVDAYGQGHDIDRNYLELLVEVYAELIPTRWVTRVGTVNGYDVSQEIEICD